MKINSVCANIEWADIHTDRRGVILRTTWHRDERAVPALGSLDAGPIDKPLSRKRVPSTVPEDGDAAASSCRKKKRGSCLSLRRWRFQIVGRFATYREAVRPEDHVASCILFHSSETAISILPYTISSIFGQVQWNRHLFVTRPL